jgi:glycerol-3-phosphate dehydrogenase (NAD(P)+)
MKICILGTGVYGIALSKVLNNGVNEINMWTNSKEEAIKLQKRRINPAMEDIKIDDNIEIDWKLSKSIKNKDVILIAIPTKFLNSVFTKLKKRIDPKQYIIIASKGLDDDKNDFLSNTLKKFNIEKKLGFISGPTFAHDLALGDYGVVTAAAENDRTLNILEKMFENTNIDISKSNDIFGVQLLGTVKNIMAIIMGMADSLKLSNTTHTKLLMIMLDEVKKMVTDFGGQEKTLMERAGIGDIILTCLNDQSRNYTYGKLLATNSKKAEEFKNSNTVEGLNNLSHIKEMVDERNKSYEFIDMLCDIINNKGTIDNLKHYLENGTKKM